MEEGITVFYNGSEEGTGLSESAAAARIQELIEENDADESEFEVYDITLREFTVDKAVKVSID